MQSRPPFNSANRKCEQGLRRQGNQAADVIGHGPSRGRNMVQANDVVRAQHQAMTYWQQQLSAEGFTTVVFAHHLDRLEPLNRLLPCVPWSGRLAAASPPRFPLAGQLACVWTDPVSSPRTTSLSGSGAEAGAGPGAGSRPYVKAWQNARHVRRLSNDGELGWSRPLMK